MTTKLTNQDRKDLDKFTKYLVYKCIQVIVQSRLGEKSRTSSKAFSSGSDWFNLALKDLPEVYSETKKVFINNALSVGQHICVEMSLRTVEGDTMVLETWSIGMSDQCDPNARVSYTVYNRMGILLKSLICVSRVTPAYRLSRKQGAETFVICYRVYMGEPQVQHLGEGYLNHKIGGVPTPLGTIALQIFYRTKLLISPQKCYKDLSVDLKDDHFMQDLSPKKSNQPRPCHAAAYHRERGSLSSDDGTGGTSSESECCATTFCASSPDSSPCHTHAGFMHGTPPPVRQQQAQRKIPADEHIHNGLERNPSFPQIQKIGAFAPFREPEQKSDNDDIPFMALLQPTDGQHQCQCGNQPPEGDTTDGSGTEAMDQNSRSTGSSNKSTSSQDTAQEDFVMVELKTPFAGQDVNSDLGRFYRDCQGAPPLNMFDDNASFEDTMNAITDQLATFEANAPDFDDFINALESEEEEG